MTGISTTTPEFIFSGDILLNNMSNSLGAALSSTQTYDYDKNRFHIISNVSLTDLNQIKKLSNIPDFFEQLNKFLLKVNKENYFFLDTSHTCSIGNVAIINIIDWHDKFYIPDEIIEQSNKWGIKEYFITAINLVKKHFPTHHDLNFSLQRDYEIDEEWITIDVSIDGDIEEVLDSYDKYIENLVYEIPWPERDKIRLSYNII